MGMLILVEILVALFDFYIVKNQYNANYQASLNDKIVKLESIKTSKIILVGNSNLSFGINSKMIEDEFNMPVVNLGLHGGLGNAFHEEIAKNCVGRGDIVIVCHTEYSDDDKIADLDLAWITVEKNAKLWKCIRKEDAVDMLRAYPFYVSNAFFMWITGMGNKDTFDSYSRNAFNEYGDIVIRDDAEKKSAQQLFKEGSITVPEINDICINRLNALNDYILDVEATLLIAGYPIGYGEYTPSSNEYDAFQEELESKLRCEVISNFTDYFIPYEYFYDSKYHLTSDGADIRTRQLIDDLHNYFDSVK